MTMLWLSRARLRRSAQIATVASLLLPERDEDRVSNGHRLIWSLFAREGAPTARSFLWREDKDGCFYMLSRDPPPQNHALLEVDPPKPFAPVLAVGDQLRFVLRANPTIARPLDTFRTACRDSGAKPSRKTAHDDIVMHALHGLPSCARAEARGAAIESAGRRWLEVQAARGGFSLRSLLAPGDPEALPDALRIDGYRVLRPPRPRKSAQMRIAVLEFEGVLTVTDPALFLAALGRGFGRAKAYGCGLMLIARA